MKQSRFLLVTVVIILVVITWLFLSLPNHHNTSNFSILKPQTRHLNTTNPWKKACQFHTCFEINDCHFNIHDKLSIYVYPEYGYVFNNDRTTTHRTELSREYRAILTAIMSSVYYEPAPDRACVFVPSIDTLNLQRQNMTLISLMLQALPWWSNGRNHMIFSMLPGNPPTYNPTPDIMYGQSLLAGSSLDITSYRMGFDIAIPVFNPLTRTVYLETELDKHRPHFLTVLCQLGTDSRLLPHFKSSDWSVNERVILLGSCEHCQQCHINSRCSLEPVGTIWKYPTVLKESVFCLVLSGYRISSSDFLDVLMAGCIPVLLRNDQLVLPFSEVLDWERGVVWIWEEELPRIADILREIPERVRKEKRLQIQFLYSKYFSSINSITMTTLHILNERVFPLSKATYESWNDPPFNASIVDFFQHSYPIPLDLPPPLPTEGFTAIILTYNRIDMLFKTITSISRAPSLAMVIVVWNNPLQDPPKYGEWPSISKPLKVIRTKQNKLSNRFYPYDEIRTTAVLSLDDDIAMLTVDEIEFGYKVWLEYPKQVVGYPGRVHWYDASQGQWKYESEWMNNVSVVLTGAAFYHKYYHYLYTRHLPTPATDWVDKHFNCEDILFNIMVSNYTGLPPIKVTSRKKFTCNNCTKDGLFTDVSHFNERNTCINLFSTYFNGLPLKTVKFRMDPVLFRVPGVEDLMDFKETGQL